MPGQKFGPAWFPGLAAGGLAVCGALLMVSGVRSRTPWVALPAWLSRSRPTLGVGSLILGLLFYILAADTLGFHITGAALLLIWTRVLGASWRVAILVALVATVAIHLCFYKALRIPLPWGVLERWAF